MGLLIFVLIKALMGRYNKKNSLGVKLTGMYWHFMGGLWIYIMLFLHFIN
jgi:cytochrome c oxidase subunit 3